jgi:2-C-methyl-D-erythritol 4-phosphate cytidylyltransferase
MSAIAVVLAAGSGLRFGSSRPKQLQVLGGATLIEHCVHAFGQAPGVTEVLVVTGAELVDRVRAQLRDAPALTGVIAGGATRADSTRRAIGWLTARPAPGDTKVLFHDAARPLVDQATIAACLAALDEWDAVGVVVPSADTIVQVADGVFERVLPRESLARCQTPQGFRLSLIRRAHELAAADPGFAGRHATDDCGVVLRYLPDVPIRAIPGSERNLKITYAGDLAIAQALLQSNDPAR